MARASDAGYRPAPLEVRVGEASPLFVVGCYRSGTTLMRRILNTHPEVWLAKETQYLAHLSLAPGDWDRQLAPELLASHVALIRSCTRDTGWSRHPSLQALREAGVPPTPAAIYAWCTAVERPEVRSGARFWGDNSPRYVLLAPLLAERWPSARFVNLVRDPRGVAASVAGLRFGAHGVGTAAVEWSERIGAALAAERLLGPDRVIHVRFEDLVADPRRELARVAGFLEVEDRFDPDDVGGDATRVAEQAHLRNVSRPIDPSVAERWRRTLTEAQVARVEEITQPLLAAFGYRPGLWRAARDPRRHYTILAREYAGNVASGVLHGLRARISRG